MSQSCTPIDDYDYEPIDLGGPSFRLLMLHQGSTIDRIECTLLQAWFDGENACPYEALSYTWGGNQRTNPIKVNGKTLVITANLFLALRELRLVDRDRILWADAICIDQSNAEERGHQVQQMGTIYSHAEQVIFWLGEGSYPTNALLDSLQKLEEESQRHVHRHWKPTDAGWSRLWQLAQSIQSPGFKDLQRMGMEMLLDRPWFRRIWILQEVANARSAVVRCGKRCVPARIFTLAPSLLGVQPKPRCQAVLDIMPGASRNNSWWSCKRDLYNLLRIFKESEASDPRDMIFALLGLATDVRDDSSLRADYTKSVADVIRDVALFLFGLPHPPSYTMPRFLALFPNLNEGYLVQAVEIYDETYNRVDLLEDREDGVMVTARVVAAAARNPNGGIHAIWRLLHRRAKDFIITEELVILLARSFTSNLMEILLEQRGQVIAITEGILKAAQENELEPEQMMDVIIKMGGEKVLQAAHNAANIDRIEPFLRRYAKKTGVTVKTTQDVPMLISHQQKRDGNK
ncbi:heterokaryon incompatibility protein-domain-containing protein [Aspergillus alliaceus]|uniref:Heterokaryon incompatibility protein-domain-containing protein n=1 Tax=Petromyces alliaceus TaxID=209559 RepID=A0A5N7C8F8_PETAA|nr:heterokaryon incompatibility protein-domain-containing protein [Aspergillus alliaceus]